MLSRCTNCDGSKFKRIVAVLKRHVAKHEFSARLPADECLGCGMRIYDGDDLERFDLAVAMALANAGITEPEALRFIRKATEPRAKEFAKLLGVRSETVSRWETGKTAIDRPTYALIHQLILDRIHGSNATSDYLRSLRKPKRLPLRVKVDLPNAA